MNIFVIGCGRWGSLITWYLDHIGHHVTLYGRQSSPRMQSFLATRQNDLLTLPDSVGLTTDLRDVEQAETVIISIGSQSLRSLLAETPMQALRSKTVVLCMKGLEMGTGERLSVIAGSLLHESNTVAVWLGPGHVQEFYRGIPNCMVIDSENADVKQEAVDALVDWYYASTYRVPMGTAEADKAIAGWLNQNTGGLLSEETGNIRTDGNDLLRLYNTIYYKSGWQDAFKSSQTKQDTFTAANGAKQKTEFMHRTESGSYRKGDGYTAAPRSLNYGRMVFVLPDEGVTPESLLQRQGFLAGLTGDYNAAELVWSVPKFDVKSSTGLNEALRSLGVTDAFDMAEADFTPLTDNGAFLSSAMQAARVKIDEEGVEAAAYTEIVCADSAMMEVPPTVEMDLDRPFLFVIFDNNNVPLFVGTVNTMA